MLELNQPPDEEARVYTRKASLGGSGSGAPATLNEEARTVSVVLATENPVPMMDWTYGRVNEVLLMSGLVLPSGGQIPLLDSHNAYSIDGQLGSLRNFAIKGGELHAEAHFSSTAERAFALMKEGHLRDISVGYKKLKQTFIPEKTTQSIDGRTFTGPVKIVTRWEALEGSMTPIGADKKAKTRAASDGKTMEDTPMPEQVVDLNNGARAADTVNAPVATPPETPPAPEQNQRAQTPPAQPAQANPAAPAANANEADMARVRAEAADIMEIGQRHNCTELAVNAIRSGTSLAAFRGQVLERLAGHSERHAPGYTPHIEAGEIEERKYRAAASDALCLRAGARFAPEKPAPGALDLRGFSLKETARDCLRRAGLPVNGDMDMVGRAFTSTSDFPAILADAAHKSVLTGALEANETFGDWTGEATATDFRDHTGVALEAFSSLNVVPQGGEYKHGNISDRGIVYSVATYGSLFAITRQAIINDDVNAFTQIPAAMGRAAMRTAGNAVYDFLTGNPQLKDGNALFSTAHKNVALSGAAITDFSFGEAITAMGTQQGSQGEALNIAAAYLLCAIARQAEAFVLLNSMVIGTQASPNQANPWRGKVQPITDARLDFSGNGAWFLAGPKGWGINVAWLGGNKTPRVEQRQGWTVDGTEFKVSLDFGCYVQDHRALYKNPGA